MTAASLYEVTFAGPRTVKVVVPDSSGDGLISAARLAYEQSERPSWTKPASDAITAVKWIDTAWVDARCVSA